MPLRPQEKSLSKTFAALMLLATPAALLADSVLPGALAFVAFVGLLSPRLALPANLATLGRAFGALWALSRAGALSAVPWAHVMPAAVAFVALDNLDGPLARWWDARFGGAEAPAAAAERRSKGELLDLESDAMGSWLLALLVAQQVWMPAALVGVARYWFVLYTDAKDIPQRPNETKRGRLAAMLLALGSTALLMAAAAFQSRDAAIFGTGITVFSFVVDAARMTV